MREDAIVRACTPPSGMRRCDTPKRYLRTEQILRKRAEERRQGLWPHAVYSASRERDLRLADVKPQPQPLAMVDDDHARSGRLRDPGRSKEAGRLEDGPEAKRCWGVLQHAALGLL